MTESNVGRPELDNKTREYLKSRKGISIHGNSLRLSFFYRGKRYRPTLKLKPTLANIKSAESWLHTIKRQIALNQFILEEHFPQFSINTTQAKTVGEFLSLFFKLKKTELDPNTLKGYKKHSKKIIEKFGSNLVSEISSHDIALWRSYDLSEYSNKYINNIFTVLRAVFDLAFMNDQIESNPMDKIRNLKLKKSTPNPFTRAEIKLLLELPTKKLSEQNYIEYTCWSGNRAEESLALAWEDIDFENRTITINRAVVAGTYKRPKTGNMRKVTLLEPVYQALLRQKDISSKLDPKKYRVLEKDNKSFTVESLRIVFMNSNSMLPFNDISVYGKVFWDKHLKQAGVDHRGANQCRHTYASQLLSTGKISLEKIALEMGNSVTMLYKHYGKFINEDALDHRKQIESALFDN